MTSTLANNTFEKRFASMLCVDFKRLFLSRFFYIILAACLVAPVLILVMTTMMDGTVSVDPNTGAETVMEGFEKVLFARVLVIIFLPPSSSRYRTPPDRSCLF